MRKTWMGGSFSVTKALTVRRGWIALILLSLSGVSAYGGVLYSTGFETPTFATGAIAGQDGWSKFGPSFPVVENFFAKTGSQAVFVDGATASQSGPFHNDSSTGPLVDLSADIAIFSSTTQTVWQFAGTGTNLNQFLGGINILPNDSIQVETPGFPILGVLFPRATAFDSTAWHHIDLLFNLTTQTYNISLDGSTIDSNVPFCGSNAGCTGATVAAYGAGFFDSFGGVAGANDSGYMDNYAVANVTSSAVPEPASLLLIASGLAFVVTKRRMTSRKG
jgi:hypothetical protein